LVLIRVRVTTAVFPSGPVTLRLIVCTSSFQSRATSGGSRSVLMPGDRASTLAQNRPARVLETESRLA
jgi:hypothetical protein